MSDDLVKRARNNARCDMPHYASIELIEALADRIEELEAKLAKAADVIEWALICGDEHQVRDWVHDAINVLSELTGGKDE